MLLDRDLGGSSHDGVLFNAVLVVPQSANRLIEARADLLEVLQGEFVDWDFDLLRKCYNFTRNVMSLSEWNSLAHQIICLGEANEVKTQISSLAEQLSKGQTRLDNLTMSVASMS